MFLATMQNKMHFAATGMTAAEIVSRRADAEHSNMGLTPWSGDPFAGEQQVFGQDPDGFQNPESYAELRRISLLFTRPNMILYPERFQGKKVDDKAGR